MPNTFAFDRGVLHVKCALRHTLEDDLLAIKDAIGRSDFADGTGLLLDLSASTEARTQHEIVDLARFLGNLGDELGNRAAVLVSNELQYGLARMLAAHAEAGDVTVSVFTELETARHWLRPGPGGRE